MSADWWRDLGSKFRGLAEKELSLLEGNLDRSLCAHHWICKEHQSLQTDRVSSQPGDQPGKPEGQAKPRRYWSLAEGIDDDVRAQFEDFATEAGAALGPPQGTTPFGHWLDKLRLYLPESKLRRFEFLTVEKERSGVEEDQEARVNFKKALDAAEELWKKENKGKQDEPDKGADNHKAKMRRQLKKSKAIMDMAIKLAPKFGVPPEFIPAMKSRVSFQKALRKANYDIDKLVPSYRVPQKYILAMKQAKYVVTRSSCTIPQVCKASASFCSRRAQRAHLEVKAKKSPAKKQAPLRPSRPKVVPIGNLNELKRRKSLSQAQAAAELDYSTRKVRYLLRDGKLTKTAKGRVAVDDKFEEQLHLRHSARPK